MFSPFLSACVLAGLTMAVHTTGIAVLVWAWERLHVVPPTSIVRVTQALFHILWWLILLHLTEISVWGAFYWWRECFPNAEAAFYFSGATYTTLGYGDLVLARPWRLLAPMEAVVGILMCGLSTGFFFVVVNRIHQTQVAKADAARAQKDEL